MKGRNSLMTSQSTSLERANSTRAEWHKFADFLRSPKLPEKSAGFSAESVLAVLRLLTLDLMIMALLIALAMMALLMGFSPPDNALNNLDWSIGTVALVVIAAPLLEELGFRSWLSGRPGHLLATGVLAGSGLAAVMLAETTTGDAAEASVGLAMVAGLILAVIAIVVLRGRAPLGWFKALFPVFFWLTTVAFALIHLLNYQEGALAILLPLVLPQFFSGAIFGFARVEYGLWASILLHALHNASAIAIILLFGGAAG